MIIIQKNSEQINLFNCTIEKMKTLQDVRTFVEKTYSQDCQMFVQSLLSENNTANFRFQYSDRTVPVSLIRSSNQRLFAVNMKFEIKLNLYQLRSNDRKHYEDILMEPFYPGYKATISDIYGILKNATNPRSDPYKYSGTHSYRMCYDIRRKFKSKLELLLGEGFNMSLVSFESFYEAIHQLDYKQLAVLFGADIQFV